MCQSPMTPMRILVLAFVVVAASAALAAEPSRGEVDEALDRGARLMDSLHVGDGGGAVPPTRDDLPVADLHLDDCVALALLNNLDVRLALFPQRKLAEDVAVARAAFDSVFSSALQYTKSSSPTSSQLQGASVFEDSQVDGSAAVGRRFEDGTEMSVKWHSNRRKTNSSFSTLNPAVGADFTVEVARSLTKMRGRDLNLAALRQLEQQAAAARCTLEATVNDVVQKTVSAFLSMVGSQEAQAIQEASLTQVEELVEMTRKRMEVGRAVEAELIKEQSALAQQREALITTRVERERAGDELLQLICPDPDLRPDPSSYRAVFDLEETAPVDLDLRAIAERARLWRPEVLGIFCQLRAQDLAVMVARDGHKPSLDVVGSVGISGLDGAFGGAQSDMASLDYPEWVVGLQYQIPLGLRAERARLRKAELTRDELRVKALNLASQIEFEVRDSMRNLRSALERVTAARSTVQFAERSYENERLLSDQGRTTPFQVNEYRLQLDDARLRLLQARLDVVGALAAVRRAEGTLADVVARGGRLGVATLSRGLDD